MRSPDILRSELGLRALPETVTLFLSSYNLPPRLVAHLILVHDVAAQIVDFMTINWPSMKMDTEPILIGAGWHDIGKTTFPEEISAPGHEHEKAGLMLLTNAGIDMRLARFALTHGTWATDDRIMLEDLVVALADTCWKGKRDTLLEQRIQEILISAGPGTKWDVFLILDNAIESITSDASLRLSWQAQFSHE